MKQVMLILMDYFYDGIEDYLLTIKGIKEINFINNENKLIIKYDSNIISLNIIKKEIYLYFDMDSPQIIMFDKYDNLNLEVNNYIMNDICCEYCLLSDIDKLLDTNGIYKVINDYNGDIKRIVNLEISYDRNKISWQNIKKILEN